MSKALLFTALILFTSHAARGEKYSFELAELERSHAWQSIEEALQVPSCRSKDYVKQILSTIPFLEQRLNDEVFGQSHAVKEVTLAVKRFAAGVNDPTQPIATLLFSGPSGVGKTELAKQLCDKLYGSRAHFVSLNMAEYTDYHNISRLIGAPPGYLGYGEGGQLSEALRSQPYSIVLLDEIEKAHPRVLKFFLQAFDDGFFTSAEGKHIDCTKIFFILTSNLGAGEVISLLESGHSVEEVTEKLAPDFMAALSPEFFNRLRLILFKPLGEEVKQQLVIHCLDKLAERVHNAREISLLFEASLVDYLMTYGMDPVLGARPLARLIDRELTSAVAQSILDGECGPKDRLICSYEAGCITIEVDRGRS